MLGFAKCEVIDVTLNRTPSTTKIADDFKSATGKLVMVVDKRGFAHVLSCPYNGLWSPDKINDYLKNKLNVSVRVNKKGVPYVLQDPPVTEEPDAREA